MKKILFILLILNFPLNLILAQFQFDYTVVNKQVWTESLCVADINNDGLDDIISVSKSGISQDYVEQINIHLQKTNNNDFTNYLIRNGNSLHDIDAVIVDDVNNDMLKDIMYVFQDTLVILFQIDANKNLYETKKYHSGIQAYTVKTGDFNNDGLKDIVVSHWGELFLKIYYQKNKDFDIIKYPKAFGGRDYINVADIDKNGLDDIVLLLPQGKAGLYTYLQKNNGIDSKYKRLALPDSIYAGAFTFAIGDLNNDGFNDLVVPMFRNLPERGVLIYFNTKDANLFDFNNRIKLESYSYPHLVGLADFDCDDKLEIIITAEGTSNGLSIYKQNNDGKYTDNYQFFNYNVCQFASGQSIASGFFNKDGKRDLVFHNEGEIVLCKNKTPLQSTTKVEQSLKIDSNIISSTYNYSKSYFTKIKKDTLPDFFSTQTDSFEIKITKHLIVKQIDSVVITTGTYCGRNESDTLRKVVKISNEKIVKIDTVLIKTRKDSIPITFDEVEVFTIYPNPTNDFIRLKANNTRYKKQLKLELFDTWGQCLWEQKSFFLKSDTIDMSFYPQAPYFLRVTTEDKKVMVFKIIKIAS